MDLATIDISPEEATERLHEYEVLKTEQRSTEDEALMAAYRAAKRGLPIINLPQVIAAGGCFANGLPRLAIVRADAHQCWASLNWWTSDNTTMQVTYSRQRWVQDRLAVGANRVVVNVPRPAKILKGQRWASTVVPSIPPRHRPRRARLCNFHILWEVEKWDPTPPHDPALLRHIRGDLWAVMAVWDLTELERAVLSARINP
jgi:hypothetical protein